jgi:hypothetical protein
MAPSAPRFTERLFIRRIGSSGVLKVAADKASASQEGERKLDKEP